MTARDTFLSTLRIAATENGGKPPGEYRFYRQYGLSRESLWNAGFDTFGAACVAADLRPNALTQRLTDDELLGPLATLTRKLGKFPSKGVVEVARKRDKAFPSWDSISRRAREGPEGSLRDIVAAWCNSRPQFADVAQILQHAASAPRTLESRGDRQLVKGFVYLMRYGSGGAVYKVGIAESVPRRHAQIAMMTPQDLRVLHSIPTDDPRGIEDYWHRRFESKRVEGKKELFRLSSEDVAAFRSRKYQ